MKKYKKIILSKEKNNFFKKAFKIQKQTRLYTL
jgi:hypothetical protein